MCTACLLLYFPACTVGVSVLGVSILGVSAPRECLLWGCLLPGRQCLLPGMGLSATGDGVSAPRDGESATRDRGVCSQRWGVCYQGWGWLLWRRVLSAPRGVVCSQGDVYPIIQCEQDDTQV